MTKCETLCSSVRDNKDIILWYVMFFPHLAWRLPRIICHLFVFCESKIRFKSCSLSSV